MSIDTAHRIDLPLGPRTYSIVIGRGILSELGRELGLATRSRRAVIVSVPAVARRYATRTRRALVTAGIRAEVVLVPDGDRSKNFGELQRLYKRFVEAGLDRSACIVALGGGMVGDLAGFAAATYLRGISFVQVPTTVLAMVDASIGGKVAVNLAQGKNLVGAFHQPSLVWADLDTLASLPRRERAAGFAEVVKAAALGDSALFETLEQNVEALLDLDPACLLPVLARSAEIKAEIVAADERESGRRALLNLGHTLGHAIETLQRYRGLLHGEAVAVGMVHAARISELRGLAPPGTEERLAHLLLRFGLPVCPPDFARSAYLAALRVDKKSRDQKIGYIALRGLGRAETVELEPADILAGGFRQGGAASAKGRAAQRRKPVRRNPGSVRR